MAIRVQAVSGMAVAAVLAGFCGVAQAQTPPPAGELAARHAAELQPLPPLPKPGPLPPPASCGAQNCLTLDISDEALRSLGRGADPAAFGEGLSFSYEAAGEPMSVYFIAARYENGRLARYDATKPVRPENGPGQVIEGIGAAVADAAVGDAQGGEAQISAASRGAPVWTVPVHTQSFMIESPRTFLIGAPDEAAVDEAAAPEDLKAAARSGTVLLLTVAPADRTKRTPEQAIVTGVVVPVTQDD